MKTKITCRHCGGVINVDIETHLKAKVAAELEKEKNRLEIKADAMARKKNKEVLEEMNLEMKDLRAEMKSLLRASREEASRKELEIIQLKQQLVSLKEMNEEMLRKHSVTSQKLQGDAYESAVIEFLLDSFPEDQISEVQNGVKGADCIQIVRNAQNVDCGKILIECKQTKNFSEKWLAKLKSDVRNENASIGIIVTEALPKTMDRFGMLEGILVCTFDDFKALISFVRVQLLLINESVSPNLDRETKAQKVYAYLTSGAFKQRFEAIIDGYRNLQLQLNKEKEYFTRNWKERQKAIEALTLNANEIYGEIKVIAGRGAIELDALEFDTE